MYIQYTMSVDTFQHPFISNYYRSQGHDPIWPNLTWPYPWLSPTARAAWAVAYGHSEASLAVGGVCLHRGPSHHPVCQLHVAWQGGSQLSVCVSDVVSWKPILMDFHLDWLSLLLYCKRINLTQKGQSLLVSHERIICTSLLNLIVLYSIV